MKTFYFIVGLYNVILGVLTAYGLYHPSAVSIGINYVLLGAYFISVSLFD